MERLTLSVYELEEYIEAYNSLRDLRYTQFCQCDRDPPSFDQFDQMCEAAYQRILRIANLVSALFKPSTESDQVSESPSASSSYVESSSLGCSSYADGVNLESSGLSALADFLLRSGGVTIYRSSGVRYSLSLWDLEDYIEEHESLRRVRYTQFSQSDRNPPSFE